jgi:phage terminase large subunit GpA-like protein
MQHWVLDYIVLPGLPSDSPADPKSVWARLDEIRRTPFLHASGRAIMISADGIDAGGHHTQDVYNYGSDRAHLACTVLGGSPRPNRPIISSAPSKVDIDWGGTKRPGGVERWMVGTDVAKDYLFNRFHLLDGPGAMHFHNQLPPEWFAGLVVEQPRTRYVKGRAVREWVKPNGARNEPLDLSVYNLAIAYRLGLHKWSALDWKRLRDKLIPPTGDLFAPAPPALPAPAIDPAATPAAAPAAPSQPPNVQTSAPVPPPPPPAASAPIVPAPAPATHRRILSRGIR